MTTVELDTKYMTLGELHERLGELLKTQSAMTRATVKNITIQPYGFRTILVDADEYTQDDHGVDLL